LCLLATGFTRQMGLDERDVGVVYATLLQHLSCTANAHETVALFRGDDMALRAAGARTDFANPKEALSSPRSSSLKWAGRDPGRSQCHRGRKREG
jgi:hypothetical protein